MSEATVVRVLPADVYDALAASAEKFGGVGHGVVCFMTAPSVPVCILGHCNAVDAGDPRSASTDGPATLSVLSALDYDHEWSEAGQTSDEAVRAINMCKGTALSARVSFADWCAELGVVRGES